MEGSPLALAAFALGTAGNVFKGLPQFVHTAIRGRVAGLAPGAVWLAFTANVLWLSFGLAIEDYRFVALSALGTAFTAGTLVRFLVETDHPQNRRLAALSLPACGGFLVAAALEQGLLLETVGSAVGIVISLPQLVHLWKVRGTATDVSGVSQTEYGVVVMAQAGWTTYWILQGHVPAAVGAAWGGAARLYTLVLLRMQARRQLASR